MNYMTLSTKFAQEQECQGLTGLNIIHRKLFVNLLGMKDELSLLWKVFAEMI